MGLNSAHSSLKGGQENKLHNSLEVFVRDNMMEYQCEVKIY